MFRPSDAELATLALHDWARSAHGQLSFSPAPEASALLRVYWVEASFGQYGEMRPLVVDGRRGASVYIRPDTDALGEEIAIRSREDPLFRDTIVYLTCLHELGHALGLEHTAEFEDIMYFFGFGGDILEFFERYRSQLRSREDIATVTGLSQGDLTQLRALYSIR
ncbi:MAG: matrixin family metalloprotease [Gammaproteobacteria bacterium]|nr:matrixin family metalloprotease [Gammaproteobacteria bacterium]